MADQPNEQQQQQQSGPVKSFMTAGPTLHYSHANVTIFWLAGMMVYICVCLCWSRILAGEFLPFSIASVTDSSRWYLERFLLTPLSIFEYPWQIIVLGLLMGMLAVIPPLTAQLLSFFYAIPLLLALAFIANMPIFAGAVLLSCIAAACRPLRFRSRFISIALCLGPQLFYWAYFGAIRNVEPVKWGFSFSPWIFAWLTAIVFAALVLLIGHLNRYRPGLNFLIGTITLLLTIQVFHEHIGFDELAYQEYIAKNNPEQVAEFQDHSIRSELDSSMKNPALLKYFENFFTVDEPIVLRRELKDEIRTHLTNDRWPSWFKVPEYLNFPAKRQWLLNQYDMFIEQRRPWWVPEFVFKKFKGRRHRSRRMPMALYYKAVTSELTVDPSLLMEEEVLHFASDYPHRIYLPIWYEIYEKYPTSVESIEARRRIAMHLAGQGYFDYALKMLEQGQAMIGKTLKGPLEEKPTSIMMTPFVEPRYSAISNIKLMDIRHDIEKLENILSSYSKVKDADARARLAKFILLDQGAIDYAQNLQSLLSQSTVDEPFYDNLLVAKALLTKDRDRRMQDLRKLSDIYKGLDGATDALFELGILKVRTWQQISEGNVREKRNCLIEARETLEEFLRQYPSSSYVDQVRNILAGLPTAK